ncbi:hypothetical protein BDZ90DRAFT_187083 [Jaminaea rosea]|uniref:Secreted protein n=1 Tax=Jaminaea rosea TaxID=1569628 RepID=A0A316UPC9_9BASI|nr:hypothetical protein BDZ90DRAFT_187083 [Jaminaea rosea]PWN27149.1 hypothetical protein BDZ90DRAFT_187083 [Jaminaea rosea]
MWLLALVLLVFGGEPCLGTHDGCRSNDDCDAALLCVAAAVAAAGLTVAAGRSPTYASSVGPADQWQGNRRLSGGAGRGDWEIVDDADEMVKSRGDEGGGVEEMRMVMRMAVMAMAM